MSAKKKAEIQKQAEAAKQWAKSSDGLKALDGLAEKIELIGEKLSKDSQLDLNSLRKPVTF